MYVSDCVREELSKQIPSSMTNDVACFVFYDKHPRDKILIDVTICTKNGELKEYFQKDVFFSHHLDCTSAPIEIKILRNTKCELFYIVSTQEEIFIVSRQKGLIQKIRNVDKHYFDDCNNSGQAFLKVVRKDDAVPVTYDENFKPLEIAVVYGVNNKETGPIVTELQRKLIEAQYSYKCNEATLKQFRNLRQNATYSTNYKLHNVKESLFKSDQKETGALKLKSQVPWVKICNKKLVIAIHVLNNYNESLQKPHVLLNNTPASSIISVTKVFEKISLPPYWKADIEQILPKIEYVVVCTIDLKEIQSRRIDLEASISYTFSGKEYLLPLESIAISSMDLMGDSFDVLCSDNGDQNTILSIMSSTEKTELRMKHLKNDEEPDISLIDTFYKHLQMDRIANNVIVYKKSPYHALNGLMIVFNEDFDGVTAYTRSPSQLLALIHIMHDSIPHKIITTPKQESSVTLNSADDVTLNYKAYASSILKRSSIILEYLDKSMIKMSESKNQEVINKIGTHIDLFVGKRDFEEFRNKLYEETKAGIEQLNSVADDNAMVID